jgi:hypothetical protein
MRESPTQSEQAKTRASLQPRWLRKGVTQEDLSIEVDKLPFSDRRGQTLRTLSELKAEISHLGIRTTATKKEI